MWCMCIPISAVFMVRGVYGLEVVLGVSGVREEQLAGVQHFSCFSSDSTHPDGAISCLQNPSVIIWHCLKSARIRPQLYVLEIFCT